MACSILVRKPKTQHLKTDLPRVMDNQTLSERADFFLFFDSAVRGGQRRKPSIPGGAPRVAIKKQPSQRSVGTFEETNCWGCSRLSDLPGVDFFYYRKIMHDLQCIQEHLPTVCRSDDSDFTGSHCGYSETLDRVKISFFYTS